MLMPNASGSARKEAYANILQAEKAIEVAKQCLGWIEDNSEGFSPSQVLAQAALKRIEDARPLVVAWKCLAEQEDQPTPPIEPETEDNRQPFLRGSDWYCGAHPRWKRMQQDADDPNTLWCTYGHVDHGPSNAGTECGVLKDIRT